jgi:hypothetical protein
MVRTAGGGSAPHIAPIERARYPATENEVFTFREGAFYGNLFTPNELLVQCAVGTNGERVCRPKTQTDRQRGLPYPRVYACYEDSLQVAYLNARICTDPSAGCFVHDPKPCVGAGPADPNSARCTWLNHAGVYQDCRGPDPAADSYPAITTYLNEPCDLIGDGIGVCTRIRRAVASDTPGRGSVGRGPRGCGGCSAHGSTGALQAAVLALLVTLVLGARRRSRARSPAG